MKRRGSAASPPFRAFSRHKTLKPSRLISDDLSVTILEHVESKDLPLAFVELPPFPAVAIKALRVMARSDSRLRELHDLIRADQAFSAEILRLVNSPLFPFRTAITNTLQATMLLGFERVQSLAVTIGIRAFLRDSLEIPALHACWRHSVASAVIAEQLSHIILADKDTLYTAGIMHDIGRLALAVCRRHDYAEFLRNTSVEPCDVLARERELFGVDHCEAGKIVVSAWNLPPDFGIIAARHHQPVQGNFDVLSVIHLSCALADTLGYRVAHALHSPSYSELRNQLPEAHRNELPEDPADLTAKIHAQVQILEHT